MCECIKGEFVVAGWICCRCRAYNGLQRKACKMGCTDSRCSPLKPGKGGERFETYEEAYKDDPSTLEVVQRALRQAEGN